MPKNSNLHKAAKVKNDEFYTQYHDIESEVNAYVEYNPNVFKDKVVFLPCDDPEWSNFTLFFAQKFKDLGIKKMISTSFAIESKNYKYDYKPTLFETASPNFDKNKTRIKGKIFTLEEDLNKDGKIDFNDLKWKYLEGDGDFRSKEVKNLRSQADIIITNPPFSLFREFLAWIMEAEKKFLIIGNKNSITYKELFPYIQQNKIWTGKMSMGNDILFDVPKEYEKFLLENEKEGSKYRVIDGKVYARTAGVWFTNMEHGKRHQPLQLMSMEDNLRFSKHKEIKEKGYQKYDNYEAIEVPYTDAIPSDYKGTMGVPISFLDKYCPEQFKLLGLDNHTINNGLGNGANKINGKTIYRRVIIQKIEK